MIKIMKRRYIGIDILRIVSVIVVFAFHANMHVGVSWGGLNAFISHGHVFMTAFFMLSGFSLFIGYNSRNLIDIDNIKSFYIRRLIAVIPLYYLIVIVHPILFRTETLQQCMILLPAELLGIQTTFSSLFAFYSNGGTWFISCIILCYLFYPVFQEIIKQICIKSKLITVCICVFILLYAPIVVTSFGVSDIYADPFFRLLEFLIGVTVSSIVCCFHDTKVFSFLHKWSIFILEFIILVIAITFVYKINVIPNDYVMYYSVITIPLFVLMLISASGLKINTNLKIIGYLSSISYAFFMAQFFVWEMTIFIINKFDIASNFFRGAIAFTICTIIAILLHECIEKPVGKVLKKSLIHEFE